MSSEEPPVVDEHIILFENRDAVSETILPKRDALEYEDMVMMCSSAMNDALCVCRGEDIDTVDHTEFVKDVVNDFNRRKNRTSSTKVQ